MLFHKFKKLPAIYFLNAPGFQSVGVNIAPLKKV